MSRYSYLLRNRSFWAAVGLVLVLALTLLSAKVLKTSLIWVAVVIGIALVIWLVRRHRAKQSSEQIAEVLTQMGSRPNKPAAGEKKE